MEEDRCHQRQNPESKGRRKKKSRDGQTNAQQESTRALTASREQFTNSNQNNRGSWEMTTYLSYEPQAKIGRLESLIDHRPPWYQPQHHSDEALLSHVPLAVSAICTVLKTLDEYTSNYPQCPEAISAGRTSIRGRVGFHEEGDEAYFSSVS